MAIRKSRNGHLRWIALGLLVAAGSVHAADTIGTMADTISDSLDAIPSMLGGASYLAGAVFMVKGLLSLKDHGEDHRSHPLSKAASQIAAAALLIAVPSTLNMGVGTLFGSKGENRLIDHGS